MPLAAALILQACTTVPVENVGAPDAPQTLELKPEPVVARDRDMILIRAQAGDTLATLAQRHLGSVNKAWWISDLNGPGEPRAGEVVAIPLRPPNPLGVRSNGYQIIPILCYHRFGSKVSKLTVSAAAFEAQMQYLARNGYEVVTLAHVARFLEGKEALPPKTVVVTIDDGYRATYDVAFPILKKYGFPATVFLYSDFVGASDALTWSQMKEMMASGLIQIQPHSKTHANLTIRLPDETDARYRERIRREVEVPIAALKDKLDAATAFYAYPYGDVNDVVASELDRYNVTLGLTVTPGGNGFFADPFLLRRTMVFGNEDLDAFKAKLTIFSRTSAR